jgi:hypothetical protein
MLAEWKVGVQSIAKGGLQLFAGTARPRWLPLQSSQQHEWVHQTRLRQVLSNKTKTGGEHSPIGYHRLLATPQACPAACRQLYTHTNSHIHAPAPPHTPH